jgi:hypothetical protein
VGKGHTIVARIHPNWGRSVPKPADAYTVAQFVADCATTADTLKNQCHIWQLSNEMNLQGEYGGEQLTAAYYVSVYKQVKTAIEGVTSPLGPQVVLLGPVSPGGVIPGVRWMDGNTYLQGMLDELSAGEVGGFGMHSYGAGAVTSALADFRNTLKGQLQIIDNAGFTDLPVIVSEWNRGIASAGDEPVSAQFIYKAYEWLHDWNTTPGSHNIVAACWFVYPGGVGWDQYSLEYWKTGGGNQDNDVWYAFQYAANQNYPAGIYGGGGDPGINGVNFTDDFEDDSLDIFGPLPDWMDDGGSGGSIDETGGALVMSGNGSTYAYTGAATEGYYFDDFTCETQLRFVDTTSLDPAGSNKQANVDVRFRERTYGYSLTLDASRDYINLRRTDNWTVIGGLQQSVVINDGDIFNIRITCTGSQIEIQVGRAPSFNDVVDWSLTDILYSDGMFRLGSYTLEEAEFEYFTVNDSLDVQNWDLELY